MRYTKVQKLFINNHKDLLSYIKLFKPNFYKDLRAICQEFIDTYRPPNLQDPLMLMTIIANAWPGVATEIIRLQRPFKALIFNLYDPYFSSHMCDLLKASSPFIEPIAFEGSAFNLDTIQKSDYDIIITDFSLEEDLGDKLVFSFESIPMPYEIHDLMVKASRHLFNKVQAGWTDF